MSSAAAKADFASQSFLTSIALICLATLPLMQALTIPVGFPLKIYEIVLLALLGLLPLVRHLSFPQSAIPMARITAYWMLLASALLVVKLCWPPPTMSSTLIESRFGPVGDGITKLVYLWLNLLGFLIFALQARHNEKTFIRIWLWGALFASGYEFYLVAANLAGILKPPSLPGSVLIYFGFGSHAFLRNSTFTEGNFAGLYFVISTLLALHAGRPRTAALTVCATILTFSTPAIVILCGLGLWKIWGRFRNSRTVVRFFVAPLLIAVVLGLGGGLAATAVFQAAVVSKLTAEEGTGEALSRVERLRMAQGAWDMFLDNPLTGVGIAQYGYNILHYQSLPTERKQIPNVVYLEFLSEDGLIVFAIFLYSLWLTYRQTDRPDERYLRFGVLSLSISFLAFPTISVMYVWAFLGLLFGRRRSEVTLSRSSVSPVAAI